MKASLLTAALFVGLVATGCQQDEVVAPTPAPQPTQAQLLVGKWVLRQQESTDGAVATWQDASYSTEFTAAGTYTGYGGTQVFYTYSYSLSDGLIQTGDPNKTVYTIKTLNSTALVLSFPGETSKGKLLFTNTYARQ